MTRWIRQTLRGLRALVRRRGDDAGFDDELREYLVGERRREGRAGLDRAEALRAARAELGVRRRSTTMSRTSVGEPARERLGRRPLCRSRVESLARLHAGGSHDARPGHRREHRDVSMLDAVVLRKLSVPRPKSFRTVRKCSAGRARSGQRLRTIPALLVSRITRLQQALVTPGSLAATTGTNRFSARLQDGQRTTVDLQLVSGNYFETLRVQPVRGRALTIEDTTERALRSQSSASVLEASAERSGRRNWTDARDQPGHRDGRGHCPSGFGGVWLDDGPDLWLPVTLQPVIQHRTNTGIYGAVDTTQSFLDQDRIAWLNLVGRTGREERRLAETLLQTENRLAVADFAGVRRKMPTNASRCRRTHSRSSSLSHGFSRLRARQSTTLLALMGLLSLILLLTAANVANLMLVRASRRRRETAVRVALGATTSRIVALGAHRALLLAGLGGAAGVLAAGWSRTPARKTADRHVEPAARRFFTGPADTGVRACRINGDRDRLRRGASAPRGARWRFRVLGPQRAGDDRARRASRHAAVRRPSTRAVGGDRLCRHAPEPIAARIWCGSTPASRPSTS